MKITAIAIEDLKDKGLELLPEEMELTLKGNAFPDTYGEWIGRYDKSREKFESFFKKDKEAGNTKYFDEYREKCNLIEKHRNVISRTDMAEKQVVDYYVPYSIKESTKNRSTEIENHVDYSICMNGNYKCEYELLFACESATRRIAVEYTSNNIPMYEFINRLEDEIDEAMQEDCEEENPFKNILTNCDGFYGFVMFDDVGNTSNIEIESASELMCMLVSARLLNCEFIENKEK